MARVFLLEDGPRKGQLVDELPAGYLAMKGGRASSVTVFDDFVAERAIWTTRED